MADRHQFRAKWHDYNGGIYFVTICSHEKRHIFGHIQFGKFIPSEIGTIVKDSIEAIPSHHSSEVLNYVVMPNHIHMVIAIGAQYIAPATEKAQNIGCLKPPKHGEGVIDNHFNSSLAVVVRTFKAAVTRTVRAQFAERDTTRAQCIAPLRVWQRNYHEHIIRNQRAFDHIMAYVDSNVENWINDCFANN